jgi:hypothetical protein
MGTYNYSEGMLIEELKDFLDELEGDFNKENLKNALEFMKNYAPTTDSSSFYENRWHKLLKHKLEEKSTSEAKG